MKILFVTPYMPSRIRVRPFNFIQALSKKGHKITVVSLVQKKENCSELKKFCESIHQVKFSKYFCYFSSLISLIRTIPVELAYSNSHKIRNKIKEILKKQKFDLIHVEHLRAANFVRGIKGIPILFDSVDCLTNLFEEFYEINKQFIKKPIFLIEWLKLKHHEPRILRRFDKVIVSTERDKFELRRMVPDVDIKVVSNGIDLNHFKIGSIKKKENSIIFSGKMNYLPNNNAALHFYNDILPKIRKSIPNVEFKILGANPPPSILELKQDSSVSVTGYVKNMRPPIASSAVSVCPVLMAAGIQNKILEAMALGTPVVTDSIGAQGLKKFKSDELFVADTNESFAERVITLLKDKSLRKKLQKNGRLYIKRNYDINKIIEELEKIYNETIQEYKNKHSI